MPRALDLSRAHVGPANTYWYCQRGPGAARARRRRLELPRSGAGRCVTARPAAAGVLHRPADRPAPRQPQHDRRLPRHLPAAARLRRQHDRQAARRAGHRRPRRAADRRVPRPPGTRARQQRPHPQHPAGRDPLAVRATPRCATPSTPRRSNGCWRSHRNARTQPRHLPHRRRGRRAARRAATGAPGPDAATTRCSLLAIQTGLRVSELTALTVADIHLGAGAHVALPSARAARTRRTPLTAAHRRRCCAAGSPNAAGDPDRPAVPDHAPARPLSRDAIEHRLATHARDRRRALPVAARQDTSPRTRCGTPPRCDCCTPASTSPSSRSGSATSSIDTDPDLPPRRHDAQGESDRHAPRPPTAKPGRYKPPDALLAFLEAL